MPIIQFTKTTTPAEVVVKEATVSEDGAATPEAAPETAVAGNESKTTEVMASGTDPADKAAEKVNIVVDGPLSHVYTRALQVMFANEGAVTIIEDNNADVGPIDAIIYACDDEAIDDAEHVRLALDGTACANKVVAIESMRVVTSRKALGMDYLNGCNIKIDVGVERLVNRFAGK